MQLLLLSLALAASQQPNFSAAAHLKGAAYVLTGPREKISSGTDSLQNFAVGISRRIWRIKQPMSMLASASAALFQSLYTWQEESNLRALNSVPYRRDARNRIPGDRACSEFSTCSDTDWLSPY